VHLLAKKCAFYLTAYNKSAVIHWFIEYAVQKTGKSREELSPSIMEEVLSDPDGFFRKIEELKRQCDNENDG
jgi:hypothetical protein